MNLKSYAIPCKRICELGHVTLNGRFARKKTEIIFFYFYRGSRRVFWTFEERVGRHSFLFLFFLFFLLSVICGLQKQFPCNLQVMPLVQCIHSNDVIIPNSSIQCLSCEVSTLFSSEKGNHRLRMLNTTLQK